MKNLKIKIFADGADINSMLEDYNKGVCHGFTTNPSLMKKAGIKSYREFAKEVLSKIKDLPISFEVFADDKETIIKEALEIASWGQNLYVKIPVINTKGEFNGEAIRELSNKGIKLNITAIFTEEQVKQTIEALNKDVPALISVFAGRIADTGINPEILISKSVELTKEYPNLEVLWASCREFYSIFTAEKLGCQVITVQPDILKKISLYHKDLLQYSKDTVNDFYNDGISLGFSILD